MHYLCWQCCKCCQRTFHQLQFWLDPQGTLCSNTFSSFFFLNQAPFSNNTARSCIPVYGLGHSLNIGLVFIWTNTVFSPGLLLAFASPYQHHGPIEMESPSRDLPYGNPFPACTFLMILLKLEPCTGVPNTYSNWCILLEQLPELSMHGLKYFHKSDPPVNHCLTPPRCKKGTC